MGVIPAVNYAELLASGQTDI